MPGTGVGPADFRGDGQGELRERSNSNAGPEARSVDEALSVGDDVLRVTALTVGNPHCVLHVEEPTSEMARRLGPLIENHPLFPKRTNVQFVKVIDQHRIRTEIWERGAGYTLASGSSSCAAAAASVQRGLCQGDVEVIMSGGTLIIGVGPDFDLTMIGPATRVAWGEIAEEFLEENAG